jgi:hypothetical protein
MRARLTAITRYHPVGSGGVPDTRHLVWQSRLSGIQTLTLAESPDDDASAIRRFEYGGCLATRERTYVGLAAARARGRKGGRRKKLGEKQRAVAVDLYRQKKHTIDEICKAVGISRPTLYKYVAAAGGR